MSPLDTTSMAASAVKLAPRWTTETKTPWIDSTVWTLASIALFFLILRVWTRFHKNRTLFADDWLLISATTLLWIHAPVVCWFTRIIFEDDATVNIEIYSYVAGFNVLLYSMTQMLSKASIAVVLDRCTIGWPKYVTWFLTGLAVLVLIPHGILGFAIICGQDPLYAQWAIPGACVEYPKLKMFKIAIQVLSIIIDIWFTLLPWKIVWNLKLKPTERFGFAFAMSLGTATCIVGIYRLQQWLSLSLADPKTVSYQTATITLWNFTEPAVTIIAATLPVLRVPALAIIRRLRGGVTSNGGPSSASRGYYGGGHGNHHNGQYAANGYGNHSAISRRRSNDEWPLRGAEDRENFSGGASQRSLPGGDGIVVKQDVMVRSESLSMEDLKGDGFKPC